MIAAALVGLDYLNTRNMIEAWLPLAAVPAIGFAAPRAGRLGPAAAVALCAIFLVCVLAVDTNRTFQRDDWRGAAHALGASTVPRAIVVTPGDGVLPLKVYLPHARLLRPGELVREVDVLGIALRRKQGEGPQQPTRAPVMLLSAVQARRRAARPHVPRRALPLGHTGAGELGDPPEQSRERRPRAVPLRALRLYFSYIASISSAYFSAIGLRLSFIVGVSSSPPGSQSPATIVNFLICSTRARCSLARVDALLHGGAHLLVVGQRLERGVLDPLLLGPPGRVVGVEHDQGGVVGPGVADRGRLADQRAWPS